ncbi:MAG TPA: hypothetical protein VMW54_00030 [Terriglobia bacterium]|nr:hypothetical protein [Terriglobia bacterium]
MSGGYWAFAILSVVAERGRSAGHEMVSRAGTLQAFRHGILILTFSAVLLFTVVCFLSVRELGRSDEGEEEIEDAGESIEAGNGPV